MYTYETILIVLGAFLVGSIPFGVVLAKLFRLPDPRTIGSGNIGATNMLRTGNKKVALLTLLLDAAKGVVAVLVAAQLGGIALVYWAAFAAVAGHCFSPWLRFKGGKGVATAIGAIIALDVVLPTSGVLFLPVALGWLAAFFLSGFVSLASILCMLVFVAISIVLFSMLYAPIALTLLVIGRHHANIRRLLKGEEPKMLRKGKRNA